MSWMPEEKWYEAIPSVVYFMLLLISIAGSVYLLLAALEVGK